MTDLTYLKVLIIFSWLTTTIIFPLQAQITIYQSDMPDVNDTFRLSVLNNAIITNLDSTGVNYTWDYSMLLPTSQRVDTFLGITKWPFNYQFFFGPFGKNASYANRDTIGDTIGGIAIQNIYYFYKESAPQYEQIGFGAKINGIDIPIPYDTTDIIYRFPATYGTTDSSNSFFKISFAGYYFERHQKRINRFDGWGTLITPFGSFQTIRVRSTIYIEDSIYADTIGLGFKIIQPEINEYKWLGTGFGIPLLTITTRDIAGIPVVTGIEYLDSLRIIPTITASSFPEYCKRKDGKAIATINGGKQPYTFLWNDSALQATSTATGLAAGTYSVLVQDAQGYILFGSTTVGIVTGPKIDSMHIYNDTCMRSAGSAVSFSTGGTLPLTFLWNDPQSQTTDSATALKYGTYTFTVTDSAGCRDTMSASIPGNAPPAIVSSVVTNEGCAGLRNGAIAFSVSGGTTPLSYLWNDASTDSLRNALGAGSYYITITDSAGCILSNTFVVSNSGEMCLQVPSGFTPNGDGKNDTWVIKGIKNFPSSTIEVFNRWGSIIYSSNGSAAPWDGTAGSGILPAGVYYYIIEIGNGTRHSGSVTIIR